MSKTVTVSTSAQLVAAAKKAAAGDTILLTAGNYADLVLNAIRPTGAVTIKSASGQNDVVFSALGVNASANLIIQNVDVVRPLRPGEPEWARAASIGGSTNISLVGINFMGSMNGNRNDDGNGLVITGSSRVSVLNSTFQQFNNATVIGRSSDIIFAGNTITDVREGVNMSGITGGLFERNVVTNVIPDRSKADHSDAFQLHAGGHAQTSSDLVFRSNVIIGDAQGLFLGNEKRGQGLFHQNIVVENNYYEGKSPNGIVVFGIKNAVVAGNTVREGGSTTGWSPAVVVGASENVKVAGNIYSRLVNRGDSTTTNLVIDANNIDTFDSTKRRGVAVASVFSNPLTKGNIDFAALNADGSAGVDVAGIGFRAVAGIGKLGGSAEALLAAYVPQFDTHFTASFFA